MEIKQINLKWTDDKMVDVQVNVAVGALTLEMSPMKISTVSFDSLAEVLKVAGDVITERLERYERQKQADIQRMIDWTDQ